MKPLRKRLEQHQKQCGLRFEILQQDYVLSWVLSGLFEHPQLKEGLIFKGGTALKKCYFGDYRFSEDLDFSVHSNFLLDGEALLNAISNVCNDIQKRIHTYAPIQLIVSRYQEKYPHPSGQEAFKIRAQFPWQRQPLTTVMVEITKDENLLFPPIMKKILHQYGEPLQTPIPTYPLEEIILEKLRAILQHTKKLHEKDWSRSRARDYYDLWRIFNSFDDSLFFDNFAEALQKKCLSKQVSFDSVESFFDPAMMANVSRTWEKWLGPLVPQLPKHSTVINTLHKKLNQLLETPLITP